MLKKLFLLSTVASFVAFPALAQHSNTTEPPPGTPPAEQTAPAQPPAGGDTSQTQQPATTDQNAPATAEQQPAEPPPSDAVIPAQAAGDVRADTLIGMTVYDTNGEKVGKVKDIIFDDKGRAKGVVLSVGGVLGLGAKSVGLQWSEVDIQPDAQVAKIQYNKNQLEAAPDFKTSEAQKAESDAAQSQSQQAAPASNAPATTTTPPASTD
jgi:sporulation protein YlmC with PRC-barrel domain